MSSSKELLIEFAKSIAIPLYNSDGIKWAVRSGPLIINVGDILGVEYAEQLNLLFMDLEPDIQKKCFPNSVCVWRASHHTINGLKKAGIKPTYIAETCMRMIKLIQLMSGNPTLLSNNHRISHSLNLTELYKISHDNSYDNQSVFFLSGLLWAYSEALYFQAREIGCEYHGLYNIDENTNALVREYKNFYPMILWEGSLPQERDITSITVITYHDLSLDIKIDAYNNLSIYSGSFSSSCKGCVIIANDKICDGKFIDKLIADFMKRLQGQVDIVEKLTTQDLYKKYLDIFWYRKHLLADMLGVSWKPPKKAYEIIEQISIDDNHENPYRKRFTIDEVAEWFDYSKYLERI